MPIEVKFYQSFQAKFAIAPEDVQFGEADSVEVTVNYAGKLIKVNLTRKSLTLTLRGLTEQQARQFQNQLQNNSRRKLTGSMPAETFKVGLETIEDAVLVNVKTSLPIAVNNLRLIETVQLEYQSQKYL